MVYESIYYFFLKTWIGKHVQWYNYAVVKMERIGQN